MALNLSEKVIKNFTKIKLKGIQVKVPGISDKKVTSKPKKPIKAPISSIVEILIKSALAKAKTEKKGKPAAKDDKIYILPIGRDEASSGGYGTVSKNYGTSPQKSYVDYEKIFSYLGKFRSQSMYENMDNPFEFLGKSGMASSFVLADRESMDKIARYDKYVRNPNMAIQTLALSLVPIAGLSSAEWEEVKKLMVFDPITYNLKSRTS